MDLLCPRDLSFEALANTYGNRSAAFVMTSCLLRAVCTRHICDLGIFQHFQFLGGGIVRVDALMAGNLRPLTNDGYLNKLKIVI